MPKNRAEIYQWHTCNLQAVQKAIGDVSRLARGAVARRDVHDNLQTLVRMMAFLIGVWAEARLKKILYMENGFSEEARASIGHSARGSSTQYEQWRKAIDMAFRGHYAIAEGVPFDKPVVGDVAVSRNMLQNALKSHLRTIIEIRNSLAHGEWVFPLYRGGTAVQEKRRREIERENVQSLVYKYAIIRHLADAVHDLVASPPTFARDFGEHYLKLQMAEINLRSRSYAAYEKALVDSWKRGRRGRGS